jgi:hypothetical protein
MRPDERQLEELIGAAFDRLPEPASARLKEIENRLVRKASRRPERSAPRFKFWWLIFALAATGAAAWWVGEYVSGESWRSAEPTPAASNPTPTTGTTAERAKENQTESKDVGTAKGNQNEIYRRERY